eukprot:817825-Rhodomonas_salina.3
MVFGSLACAATLYIGTALGWGFVTVWIAIGALTATRALVSISKFNSEDCSDWTATLLSRPPSPGYRRRGVWTAENERRRKIPARRRIQRVAGCLLYTNITKPGCATGHSTNSSHPRGDPCGCEVRSENYSTPHLRQQALKLRTRRTPAAVDLSQIQLAQGQRILVPPPRPHSPRKDLDSLLGDGVILET